MNHKHLAGATGIAALGFVFVLAAWGPLDPPDGPITSTYKTLTEVEPRIPLNAETAPGDADYLFKIPKSGSYYLTGNIKGVPGKGGILIGVSRVTLDLNGYAVEGVNGATNGIRVNTDHGVTIRNGNIFDFEVGVDAYETSGGRLENLTSTGNTVVGFKVGPGATVTNCISISNPTGFNIFADATLTGCVATGGAGRGFDIGQGSTLSHCNATKVGTGFYIDAQAVLDHCAARDNTSHGFNVLESAVLSDCSAYSNASAGFLVTARSRLTRCHAGGNVNGFYLVEGNSVVECTASSNTGDGLTISGNSNTVERSTFHENGGDGLRLFEGVGNSIDGNLATYNTLYGIYINDSDNLTVRNRARGNAQGNYQFVANTDYGVVLTNPGAGFTSSAAWANFAY